MNCVVHKIFELKRKKRFKEIQFIKKKKKFIVKLLLSETRLKIIETSPHEYIKVNDKWYDFNHLTFHYQLINFS